MSIVVSMKTVSTTNIAYAALTGAVLLWAGSFIAMRIAVSALPPGLVIWLRMAIALVMLIPAAGILIPKKLYRRDLIFLLPMVLLQPCIYFLLESTALTMTSASQAGIIASTVPVFVALGALIFLKEAMGPRQWYALFLSIAGIIGLTMFAPSAGSSETAGSNPLLGNILETAAMAASAGNFLLVKRLARHYSSWSLTAFQVLGGALFFLPALRLLPAVPPEAWSLPVVISILFLGLFVTFGGFGLYNYGQTFVPAGRASLFINLIPVITAVLGWAILRETLTVLQIASGALVISAVRLGTTAPEESSSSAA